MRTKYEGILTTFALLERAFLHKGLRLQKDSKRAYSEPIKTYMLDEKLLAFLKTQGFTQQPRPDCRDEIFTLIHEKFAGYWNFQKAKSGQGFDLLVNLVAGLKVDFEKGGIIFWPLAFGSFVSPDTASDKIHFRLFKALVESDENAPAVAKELAASDGSILVTWAELGLGGLKRLRELFDKFAGRREAVSELGRDGAVFDPAPRGSGPDELWVTEEAQAGIVQAWREQLQAYRNSLAL